MNFIYTFHDTERFEEICDVLIEEGFATVLSDLGILPHIPIVDRIRLSLASKEKTEHRIRRTLTRLGPVFLEFARFLELRPDLCGWKVANELSDVTTQPHSLSLEEVQHQIFLAYKKKHKTIFSKISEEPYAVDYLTQTHIATLKGKKKKVTVTIFKPGVKKHVETDMHIVKQMLVLLSSHALHSRHADFLRIFEEFYTHIQTKTQFSKESTICDMYTHDQKIDKKHTNEFIAVLPHKARIIPLDQKDLSRVDDKDKTVRTIYTQVFDQVFIEKSIGLDPHDWIHTFSRPVTIEDPLALYNLTTAIFAHNPKDISHALAQLSHKPVHIANTLEALHNMTHRTSNRLYGPVRHVLQIISDRKIHVPENVIRFLQSVTILSNITYIIDQSIDERTLVYDLLRSYEAKETMQKDQTSTALLSLAQELDTSSNRIAYSTLIGTFLIAGTVLMTQSHSVALFYIAIPFYILAFVAGMMLIKTMREQI
ncbi:MAG: hypothetical protein ACI8Y7_000737 [Candidatus Woesearchaeota archaeon]|jgi:hypothetical protein